jgi:uncharacterized membrane protein
MKAGRSSALLLPWMIRCITAAVVISAATSFGCHAQSTQSTPVVAMARDTLVTDGLSGWHRSLAKSLSYQAIVVSTDQLLYWTLVTGTAATGIEFFIANAVTGVAYYVAFDETWGGLPGNASGTTGPLGPAGHPIATPPTGDDVSLSKAVAYRMFDTARVLTVTLAVGAPLVSSVEVAIASAAVRTGVYIAHDYVWSYVPGRL